MKRAARPRNETTRLSALATGLRVMMTPAPVALARGGWVLAAAARANGNISVNLRRHDHKDSYAMQFSRDYLFRVNGRCTPCPGYGGCAPRRGPGYGGCAPLGP